MRNVWASYRCLLVAAMAVCAACAFHPTDRERSEETVAHVKVAVANKGSESLYEVKVRLGAEEFPLGNFAPGIIASRKFFPRPEQLGKTVTVVVEYEDEEERVIRLEGDKAIEVFANGEIRLEIGDGKLLAERISKK